MPKFDLNKIITTVADIAQQGKNVAQKQKLTEDLVTAAGYNKSKEEMQKLIDAGADINGISTRNFYTPLGRAIVKEGSKETIKFLLEHGADVNIGRNFGADYISAMELASQYHRYDILTLLDTHNNHPESTSASANNNNNNNNENYDSNEEDLDLQTAFKLSLTNSKNNNNNLNDNNNNNNNLNDHVENLVDQYNALYFQLNHKILPFAEMQVFNKYLTPQEQREAILQLQQQIKLQNQQQHNNIGKNSTEEYIAAPSPAPTNIVSIESNSTPTISPTTNDDNEDDMILSGNICDTYIDNIK